MSVAAGIARICQLYTESLPSFSDQQARSHTEEASLICHCMSSTVEGPVWLGWCRSFNGELCRSNTYWLGWPWSTRLWMARQSATYHRTGPTYNIQFHTQLDCYKFSFFSRTIRAWNILPTQTVQAWDTEQFKIFQQQWYSKPCI